MARSVALTAYALCLLVADDHRLHSHQHPHSRFPKPFSTKEAIEIVAEWAERANVTILQPSERHWEIFSRFLSEGQAVGALVMDAHLAALAVEHGATLATTDRDFTRFADLQTFNPIAQVR